jgi:hypothetical protein
MKTFRTIVLLLCFGAALANAQTVLNQTTLAAALPINTSTVRLTSGTGVAAPGRNGTNQIVLVIEREAMLVATTPATTQPTVYRGQFGTSRAAHPSGATVYVAPVAALARGATPSGSCTRPLLYAPLIYVPPVGPGAVTFDCLGGKLVQTNPPVASVGAVVASATTIVPTGTFFTVSGTTAIATITVPAGFGPGNCIGINPTGIFATTTAGNIGLISSASVVGRVLFMCWDGTKWWPSYVS